MNTPTETPQILLITRNLPPLVGGMERMMQQFAEGLCRYSELTVIGPNGCKQYLPEGVTVYESSPRLGPFLLASTWLAIWACSKTRFDVVIGGSGLIGPTLRLVARLFRHKTLVYLHGLDLVVNNLLYQMLFVPSLRSIDSIAVNSENTCKLAMAKGIDKQRIVVVHPGTSLPAPIDSVSRQNFRRRHAIRFKNYLLFTGRMTKRKGLSAFLQNALPHILAKEPDIGLIVVGENPQDSLNHLGEQAQIAKTIVALNLQERVQFLGKLDNRDLEICYAEASVQIFPLVHVPGDVEGFGMVAIEAAACGTPTVAFELGGVADAISEDNGHLVPAGDFDLFSFRILEILRTGKPDIARCITHAREFSWQSYGEKMQRMIDALQ